MVTIGIDTATDRLSVALRDRDGRTAERGLVGARQHARALLGMLDELLHEFAAGDTPIDAIAVSDGPGSFTGLRVGATVAKALIAVDPVPLLTASTLLVQAKAVPEHRGRVVLSVSSALRGELYAGFWAFDSAGAVRQLEAPVARAPEQLEAPTGSAPDLIVGSAPAPLLATLRARWGVPVLDPGDVPRAAVLLDLVQGASEGVTRVADPGAWEPNYGRPAEAQARWEEVHGTRLPDPAGRLR